MTRLLHRAMVYADERAFLDATIPFLHEGLVAGEVVLAVAPASSLDLLRRTLGTGDVEFRDAACWYAQPTRTIAAYSSFIDHNPGRRLRVLAEPGWEGGTPAEISEWTRYESIVNQAFAQVDASVLCLYDARGTAADVLDGALRTHPELLGDSGPHANAAYTDPATVYAEIDGRPLPPVPPDAYAMPVDDIDLRRLRAFIGDHAGRHGISSARLHDLLVATTEVATNAIRHGLPPVTCRTWADNGDVVVDVTDGGHWTPEGLPGFLPPDPFVRAGFGLWGVRMLCPLVQLRTGPGGTDIRLRVRTR
ncbi:sensor histidine kinase [Actinoallomurus iriomotensis]|uniref:Anti-sigma regulatory factor n=1 Tax=Actinoallomurus iriomotensis TaxID=478107 RepID=A0A9W6RJL8_9ACTN|nr:sensor histidine kinase [Actinoallomurus iriomotensis]GLY77306.1 anti-sigma regulatory factor [Actinoallomurus iriomotensis]